MKTECSRRTIDPLQRSIDPAGGLRGAHGTLTAPPGYKRERTRDPADDLLFNRDNRAEWIDSCPRTTFTRATVFWKLWVLTWKGRRLKASRISEINIHESFPSHHRSAGVSQTDNSSARWALNEINRRQVQLSLLRCALHECVYDVEFISIFREPAETVDSIQLKRRADEGWTAG